MSRKRLSWTDLLFGVQVVGAAVFCGIQFFKVLGTAEGQSLTMLLAMQVFSLINLLLVAEDHRVKPSRETSQARLVYLAWFSLIGLNVGALLWNGMYRWSENDTVTTTLIGIGILAALIVGRANGVGIRDSMIKGLTGMAFKVLPQFAIAFKIAQEGGASWHLLPIMVGNLTILLRIWHLWLTACKEGWTRSRVWLMLGEGMNELSWACVTVVWIIQ